MARSYNLISMLRSIPLVALRRLEVFIRTVRLRFREIWRRLLRDAIKIVSMRVTKFILKSNRTRNSSRQLYFSGIYFFRGLPKVGNACHFNGTRRSRPLQRIRVSGSRQFLRVYYAPDPPVITLVVVIQEVG